jgi:hypothetical protein
MHQRSEPEKNSSLVTYLISGQIHQEFAIAPSGVTYNGYLGGNMTYAFSALSYWDSNIGLISRAGSNFPQESLSWLISHKGDLSGIKSTSLPLEQRRFYSIKPEGIIQTEKTLAHYSKLSSEFPKLLLGYSQPPYAQILPPYLESDIPNTYLQANSALLCADDLPAQNALSSYLRKGNIHTFALEPAADYMLPKYFPEWQAMFKTINILFTSENMLRSLFDQSRLDLWELMDEVSALGVQVVIINLDHLAYWVVDNSSNHRWVIPAYPAQIVCPIGIDASFDGGFMAAYHKTYDPLESTLTGIVTSSLMTGGMTPDSVFEAAPGLADARLTVLRSAVKSR